MAVSYPREFVRSVIEQVNHGATRYTAGLFRSKEGVEEVGRSSVLEKCVQDFGGRRNISSPNIENITALNFTILYHELVNINFIASQSFSSYEMQFLKLRFWDVFFFRDRFFLVQTMFQLCFADFCWRVSSLCQIISMGIGVIIITTFDDDFVVRCFRDRNVSF